MSLHLFKSIQCLFWNYFNIFSYTVLHIFFVKFIPKYLIFVVYIANGIFASIITSAGCLYTLILYLATSRKSCAGFLPDSLGYTTVLESLFTPSGGGAEAAGALLLSMDFLKDISGWKRLR